MDVRGEVARADDAAPDEVTQLAIVESGGVGPCVALASPDQSDLKPDAVQRAETVTARRTAGASDALNAGVIGKTAQQSVHVGPETGKQVGGGCRWGLSDERCCG